MMKRANFRRVFLGIETPVEESLKETQKGQNTKRNLIESVRKIQSYGMEVMAGFIVGFDNDPADIFQRQIDFIRESAIPMAMVGLLTALPDTQLWRRLEKEGRLLSEGAGTNTEASLNFVPKMDRQTLIDGYKKIMQTIYSPEEYYERVRASLRNTFSSGYSPAKAFKKEYVLGFFRVLFKLGHVRLFAQGVLAIPPARLFRAARLDRRRGRAGRDGLSLPQNHRAMLESSRVR